MKHWLIGAYVGAFFLGAWAYAANAQVTHPDAQLVVVGTVEHAEKFTPETQGYTVGKHLGIVTTHDTDLDKFFASKVGKKVRILVEVSK